MVKKNNDKYLGPFKVMGIVKQDITTPLGGEVVQVLYDGRPSEIMPIKALDLFSTEAPTDLTDLQRRRFDHLIPKIIEQMAEIDVRMFEISTLVSRVHETITDHFERASSFLWTKDDNNWVRGMNYMNNRTIIETHHVLLGMKEDEQKGVTNNTIEPPSDDRGGRAQS